MAISLKQSIEERTETTLTVRWSVEKSISYLWYSTDGGSTWTGPLIAGGKTGIYTIPGLTADTEYSVKTRVQFSGDQSTADSSVLSASTYAYPYANAVPDFTIGEEVTVGLFNPLSRTVTLELIGQGGAVCASETVSGASFTGFSSAAVKSALYATIPNGQIGGYRIRVTYDGHAALSEAANYRVNVYECLPRIQFNAVTYADVNAASVSFTGDDQKIIRNLSVVRFSAAASGLTAQNSATIYSCEIVVDGQHFPLGLSGGSYSGYNTTVNRAFSFDAEFLVTDSRNLSQELPIRVTVYDWFTPYANITVQRQSNYYSETDVTADAYFASVGGNNAITIAYKARKTGTLPWTLSGTLTSNVTTTLTLDNIFAWDVQIIITDSLGASVTYDLAVQKGLPIIFFDRLKNSVGVNCFPVDNNSLEVDGINAVRTVLTLSLSHNLAVTAQGVYVRLPLNSTVISGSKLSVMSNGVLVGNNVGKILVSAKAVFKTGQAMGERTLCVGVGNGTGTFSSALAISRQAVDSINSDSQTIVISPTLVSVTPGQLIYLFFMVPSGNGTEYIQGGTGALTALTVETIA